MFTHLFRVLLLVLSLALLVPVSLSLPKKLKRAKRYANVYDYGDYSDVQPGAPGFEYDEGLLPGEVDTLRDIMMQIMDILDDGHEDQNVDNPRSVNDEGEPVVVIVVEDENQDPNDITMASLLYSEDDPWSRCTRTCTTRRTRTCVYESLCGSKPLIEEAFCYAPGSKCESKVNDYLESEGYIIVDYKTEDVEKEEEESESDHDYSPDYMVEEDYDEYDMYPDAAENTYGDYYDYGWADYINSQTDDESYDTGDYYYDHDHSEGEQGEEEVKQEVDEDFVFEGCGKRHVNTKDGFMRILGGHTAQKGTWPWQVAVMNRFKETFCGGTLIAPKWVLTAAHCSRKRLYIKLGEHDLYAYDKAETEIRVEKTFSYPEYDEEFLEHDIALIKLPREVSYNRHILPACLPGVKTVPPMRSQCIVSGWGKEKETHIFGSDVLKYVRVPIVTKKACRNAYPDHPITRNHVCAGFRKGAADTCAGDSGGPLVCDDEGAWTVHGVTSFGEGCGDKGKFGVYTKVKNYINWIKQVMEENQ